MRGDGCLGQHRFRPSFVGPCIHTFQDEVLHLEAASGTNTGAVIAEIFLTEFGVDREPRDPETIIEQRSVNVTRAGAGLRCTLPCAFGIAQGLWKFTAAAVGYVPTAQAVAARYGTFSGGCPSFETDGTRTVLQLDER